MFVHCSIKFTDIYYGWIVGYLPRQNKPVNISLCRKIKKRDAYDGHGGVYPALIFRGVGIKWVYPRGEHEIRDRDYERIVKL
jgi:hypothetical protein